MISPNHLEALLKNFQQHVPEKKEKPAEKPSIDFYEFYKLKTESVLVTKAMSNLGTNEGQPMTASQLLDTGVVFPAPSPSKSGEFLIVLLPSFRQGNMVYTLHNKENKALKNTIRVKQTSLENYNYLATEKTEKPSDNLIDISKEKIVNNTGEPVVTPKQKQEYQAYLKKVHDAIENKKQQNALDPIINAQRSGMITLDMKEIDEEKEFNQFVNSALSAAKKEQQHADACFLQPQEQKSFALFKNLITKAYTPPPVCTNTYIDFLTKLADVISKVNGPNTTPSVIQTTLEELLDIDVYTGEEEAEREITHYSILREVFQYLGVSEKDYLSDSTKKVPEYVKKIVNILSALHQREGSSRATYDFPVRKAVLRAMIVKAISDVVQFNDSTKKALKQRLYAKFLQNGQQASVQLHAGQDKQVLIGKIDIFDADHFYEVMSGYEPLMSRERQNLDSSKTRAYIQAVVESSTPEIQDPKHAKSDEYQADVLLFARLVSDSVSRLAKVPMVPNEVFNPEHFVGITKDEDIVSGNSMPFTMVGTDSSGNQQFDLNELINEISDLSDFENPKVNAFIAKTAESFFSALGVTPIQNESSDEYFKRQQAEKRSLFKAIKAYLSQTRLSFAGAHLNKGNVLEALIALETIYKTVSNETGILHFGDDTGVAALSKYLNCNSSDTYSHLNPSTAALENQEPQVLTDFAAAFKPTSIASEYSSKKATFGELPTSIDQVDAVVLQEQGARLSSESFIKAASIVLQSFSKIKESNISSGKISIVLTELKKLIKSSKLKKFLKTVSDYIDSDFEENSTPTGTPNYPKDAFVKRLETFLQAYWYGQYSEKPEVSSITGEITGPGHPSELRLNQTTIWSPFETNRRDYGEFTFGDATYVHGPDGIRTMVTPPSTKENETPVPSEEIVLPDEVIEHNLDLSSLFSLELAKIIARNSVDSTGQPQTYNLQESHAKEALEKAKNAVVLNIMEIFLKISGGGSQKVELKTSEAAQLHLEKLKQQLLEMFYTVDANINSIKDKDIDDIFTNVSSLLRSYSPVNMHLFSGSQKTSMVKLPEKVSAKKPKSKPKPKKTKSFYEIENYNDLKIVLKAVSNKTKKDEPETPPKCPETITQDENGDNVVSFRDSLLYAAESGVHVLNASKSSGLKGAHNGFGDIVNSKITNAQYDPKKAKILLANDSEIETDVSEVKVGDKSPSFNSISRFALATDALYRSLGTRKPKTKLAVATTRFKDRRLSTVPADIDISAMGEYRSKLKL